MPETRRYLLDTNIISELRKTKPHGAVTAWLQSVSKELVAIPAVVIGEIQAGAEVTRLRTQQRRRKSSLGWRPS